MAFFGSRKKTGPCSVYSQSIFNKLPEYLTSVCFKFRLKHTGLKIVTVLMLRHLGFKIRETGEVGQADPVCLV